jgi:hypothetical protein
MKLKLSLIGVVKCLGQPLYDTNSSIAECQCVYVVRNSSDTALVLGVVARDWRIKSTTKPTINPCGCRAVAWHYCWHGRNCEVSCTGQVCLSYLLIAHT